MPSRRLTLTLIILVFFVIQLGVPLFSGYDNHSTNSLDSHQASPVDGEMNKDQIEKNNQFQASDDTLSGVMDPALVEQYGYSTTGVLDSRTDSGVNATSSIPIDNNTGWMGSQTQITLWDMERLYAENGTFDEGIGGTNTYPDSVTAYPNGWGINELDWYDPSGGTQTLLASYDSDDGYVSVETHGEERTVPSLLYWHYDGTYVYWNQTVNNVPYSNNLTLTFKYNYDSGILDKYLAINGYILLTYFIDNDIYIIKDLMDMTSTPARNTWYNVIEANITDAPASFQFGIGIYIFTTDSKGYFVANPGGDYDDDGGIDGDLTRVIRVLLDDIKLVGNIPPSYEEVDLKFHAGEYETSVIQVTDYGTAIITNPSYWNDSSVILGISSNVSISCSYETKLLTHNFRDTTRTSQPTQVGVTYTILPGESSFLSMFTYIGSEGVSIYENFTVQLYVPIDWENATVYDPFLNDVTGQCTSFAGLLVIPTSLLDRLGWWQITFDSPNYVKSIESQIHDGSSWSESTLFRPGNITRTQIELGTMSASPGIGSPVQIDWIMPNGTIWTSDSISTIIAGNTNSSIWTFGSANTTAGVWKIQVIWLNGTELAYGFATFDLYHSASATVKYPILETDYGLVLSNQITLVDIDEGHYLLDDSVSMTANWSDTIVEFSPNFAKNWWQAEFDTALLENGRYNVVVEITRPYFDPITTQFTIISIFETSLEILNAGLIPIERGLNEIFTVQLSYELWNGTGIAGAQPTVISTSPQEGIQWNNFIDNGNGLYSIDIISNISTTYEITIKLSKPYHYNSTDSFTLIISKTGTELELVNGTADVVQYGSSYRLVVEYRNSTGAGLPGADIQIVTITPGTGLPYVNFTHLYDGYYEVILTPSTTGTFSIVISASIFNHQTQFETFTLTGVVVPTVLTSLPSSTIIQVNQSFVIQLNFHDENLNPIDTATISVLDPPAGIIISNAIPIGGGLYNITVKSSQIDIYNLLFRASAPYYQSSIVGFTVSVTALPTSLDIANGGSIPVENGLNEVFTVQLNYELLNGTGVAGAEPTLIFSGPENGLLWSNFIDYDNGYYTLDIICNTSATYGVTITLAKTFYYSATDSFVLIIGETGSELELLNGTADVVLSTNSYRLVVEYRNSTGYGLPYAVLEIVTVTPSVGLTYTNFTHITGGYYEITLTPNAAGTFSIVISASFVNHETQYKTFTLTASGLPTILISTPPEKTVAVNQTFTLQLRFWDEGVTTPINDAEITLVNPPAGLIYSAVVPVGDGRYNITLQSFTIKTYDLLFRASADNYQSASVGFTFDVTEIQTTLQFEDDVSSTAVEFEEPFELIIYYNRIDPNTPIQGANITILPAYVTGLDIVTTEYTGYYIITIKGEQIGTYALTIVAERENYRIATKQFYFEVEEIDTTVEGSNPFETLYIGRTYEFTFDYIFESNSSNIRGATIVPFGAGADWVTYIEMGSGQYLVNLTPQELGDHSVLLTFEKTGFASVSFRLTFEVGRIPITVEVLQGLSAHEYSQSLIIIKITETDTGHLVSGVEAFCYIIDPNGAAGSSIAMDETDTEGHYSAYITMPVAEGIYQLNITCDAAYYILNTAFSINLQPQRDFMSMVFVTTTRYYPVIIALAAIGVGLIYRRGARKRRIRENKETLAIKRRFDDVRSILGVIVLHKDSGLPVYSKILREGLEETVISAFITAITSFRGEFDIETTSEEWGLIPISDIVRVISTNKLVCAFITTGNPSPEQRERMIQFAKTVGFIFDETMEDVPVVVLDHHTTAQFDALFEDILDGQLLRTYKLDESKKVPTNTCALERIARKHGEEFKLEELASEIASCGLEETRVYKAIMMALENHYLVRTEDSPFSTELLRAPDIVHEEVE